MLRTAWPSHGFKRLINSTDLSGIVSHLSYDISTAELRYPQNVDDLSCVYLSSWVVILFLSDVRESFHWFGMQPTSLTVMCVYADPAVTPCNSPTNACYNPIAPSCGNRITPSLSPLHWRILYGLRRPSDRNGLQLFRMLQIRGPSDAITIVFLRPYPGLE